MTFRAKFAICLILSLTLSLMGSCSNPVLAAENRALKFSCLDRLEKEAVAVCFLENDSCHQALKEAVTPVHSGSWSSYVIVGLVGVAAGMAAAAAAGHH